MSPGRIGLLFLLLLLALGTGCSDKKKMVEGPGPLHYSNLDQLVSVISRDGLAELENFYLTNKVSVKPFRIAGEHYIPETSLLSFTLADQMNAGLSSLSTMSWFRELMKRINIRSAGYKPKRERLEGLIEELDGFLRVHMSARNSFGEKRDISLSVEMSEPLYKALHTRVKIYGSQ